ncbi:MAG: nicotinate phosphoribosyltransferase [Spirochaetaceae bacterium]|jgi:nicotinate phosphoribosyltransferase|nr:nicotinate phosphoribosyltransferase [Spirochaetaceae bacterium]
MSQSLPNSPNSALFTDFYELTMAQGFWKQGKNHPAVFDMFFRKHPFSGGFSVFAGLGTLLDSLEAFSFSPDDIAYLSTLGVFEPAFLDFLRDFRFSGDLYAFDEGSVIFPGEPLVRIHANLIEAQIIEGLVLNHINFQSLIATKTARVFLASRKGRIMEFGLRRAQGPNGALWASRAAFIGGAGSTSNTLAGRVFGIPVSGTMAHSWVMSFPSELEAFRAYAALYPDATIFLIDTYDTLQSGIKNAVIAGGELAARGHNFGVRLDSGDMQYLSTCVRKLLDEAGFPRAGITVSNDLSEEIIETLVSNGAPITSWGVGTQMVTGGVEAAFSGVYKLASRSAEEGEGEAPVPVMKFSDNPEKTTNPGIKEVWRLYDRNNAALADVLALEGEEITPGRAEVFFHPAIDYRQVCINPARAVPLLKKKLSGGRRVEPPLSPGDEIRRARQVMEGQLESLDITFKRMLNPHIYKVSISRALKNLKLGFIEARLR